MRIKVARTCVTDDVAFKLEPVEHILFVSARPELIEISRIKGPALARALQRQAAAACKTAVSICTFAPVKQVK